MNLLNALWSTTSAVALLTSAQALAQEAPVVESADEILVTGSRIVRSGGDAPTPVTIIGSEQLKLAAPGTIADGLNQLPQFRGSSRPQNGGVNAGATTVGANLLNLRNLGPQRSLILLDGRRTVPTSTTGSVDVGTLPEALVQRVEVVTGGASAAYGSDAVAGVVNFVLDTKYTGLKGEISGGISNAGDAESGKASLTYGHSFGGDRGHIIANAEYFRIGGIGPLDLDHRDWSRRSAGILPNVPGTATPNRFIFGDNVLLGQATYGGLIISPGALQNIAFGPGGTPQAFTPGATRGTTFMVGGSGDTHDSNLTAGVERINLFAHATYALTDTLEMFVEGSHARVDGKWSQYYNFSNTSTAYTIFSGNPFLPAAVQAQMTAANISSFRLGRVNAEGDPIGAINSSRVSRGAIGLNGSAGDNIKFDASYSLGRFTSTLVQTGAQNYNKVYAAVDAVRDPATGNIVCRSTLLFNLNQGCVPLNVFGQGSPSAAAIEYYQDDQTRRIEVTQHVLVANMQANLFSIAGGQDVKLAAGVEYRSEDSDQTTSANTQEIIDFTNVRGGVAGLIGQRGPFAIGNFQPIKGKISAKEVYAEIDAPLLRDVPFAYALDLNVAARLTDYSTSGSVTTWKVSGSYAPIEDLRLRVTRSRDIRAANVSELYSGGVQGTGTIRDPAGLTQTMIQRTVGNPDLQPEKADTLTIGGVYRPAWLPGADFSVDYYDIEIDGAIAALTAQTTVDECARGSATACANINIIAGIYRIQLPQLNLASLNTSGVDFEAGYRTPALGGDVSVRALFNYQGKYVTTTPGAAPIDRAGEVGLSSNPKWIGALNVNYTRGPLTVFAQERFISSGVYDRTFVEGININDNTIPAVFYTDLTVKYRLEISNREFELFGTINNLFDKDPPLAAQSIASLQRYSNFALYDVIGRYLTAGVRFKF